MLDWLRANGGEDVFLNNDPERGIAAGERWKEALPKATRHCEAILALLSPEWLAIPSREVGVLVHDVHRERE